SKSCLNSKEERRERTATSSSVTRSGTRRENAFFFRIAIRVKKIARFYKTAVVFCVSSLKSQKRVEVTHRSQGRCSGSRRGCISEVTATNRLPLRESLWRRRWT